MKLTKKLITLFACAIVGISSAFAGTTNTVLFSHGVNLTEWFESWAPGIPNLKRYDETTFMYLKEMGCDIIRLPIHFDMVTVDRSANSKDYEIDPIIWDYLDKACDWAEKYQIYLIIDNHSANGLSNAQYPKPQEMKQFLQKLWPQIANRYKNRSNYILYEILNEPQMTNAAWEPIQKEILKLIRSIDKNRTVVVSGGDWGGLDAMTKLSIIDDDNLIYSFHFYDPFIFTHQRANWTSPELADAANIPFPYDRKKLPAMKGKAKGSWVESNMRVEYAKTGTPEYLRKTLKRADDFRVKHKVPVICGEMGVFNYVAPDESRATWYKEVGQILQDFNIPFTVWGLDSSFGICKTGSVGILPDDLDERTVTSLNFKIPSPIPEENNSNPNLLVIYDDFEAKYTGLSSWNTGNGYFFDKCSKEDVAEGSCSIKWENAGQYTNFASSLQKTALRNITTEEFTLSFKVKFTNASQKVQIRFVDSDDPDNGNLPWRLAYNLHASEYPLNTWLDIELTSDDMTVFGAWSNKLNKWYNPSEPFDWKRLENLQFVAEEEAVKGAIYFDDIKFEIFPIE